MTPLLPTPTFLHGSRHHDIVSTTRTCRVFLSNVSTIFPLQPKEATQLLQSTVASTIALLSGLRTICVQKVIHSSPVSSTVISLSRSMFPGLCSPGKKTGRRIQCHSTGLLWLLCEPHSKKVWGQGSPRICVRSLLWSWPHSLQHLGGSPVCLDLRFGVLTQFFQEKSLHCCEAVVVICVLIILVHFSGEITIPSSVSHFLFT